MMRFLLLSIWLFSLVFGQSSLEVGIWRDNEPPSANLSQQVQQELNTLAASRMKITYRTFTLPEQPSKDLDLLITIGPRSSQLGALRQSHAVPTILGTILDAEVQDLPHTPGGGSGVENFNYIRSPFSIKKDLEIFRQIRDFSQLAILLDKDLARLSVQGIPLDGLSDEGETFTLVPLAGAQPREVLDLLPQGCDAVYLLPLGPSYRGDSLSQVLDALSEAGYPTFALLGSSWVASGALAGRAPEQSSLSLARRIALNALAILEGEPASTLPTETAIQKEDFVINLQAVEKSKVYPSWELLGEARLIKLELQPEGQPIHLRGIIGEALAQNLNFKISQRETEAGQQEVRLALAEMLPELGVGSNFTAIDQARSEASFGATQPFTWAASATLGQVLFSEPLYANLRIQKLIQASRLANQDQTELDVVLEAAEAYFNVLLSASIVELQNKNVDNTSINLDLAKEKEAVGYSGVSEVYRWESQLALNKIDLNDARANFHSAQFNLNQVLNRPQNQPMALAEAELGDSLLSIMDSRLLNYLNYPGQLDNLSDFLVAEGLRNLPEIRQIELSLEAQERLLKSRDRAFYLPSLGLNAQTNYNIFQGGLEPSTEVPPRIADVLPDPIDGFTWTLGLGLNFPIYQGDRRSAQKQQASIDLARIRNQRKDLQNQLELRIRSNLQTAGASFAEINLARNAATAAEKNLEIAQRGYREGIVPIAQLIDAQEAALQTQILATNAVYSFLRDFLRVERAIGFYYFLASPEEKASFFARADQFFKP